MPDKETWFEYFEKQDKCMDALTADWSEDDARWEKEALVAQLQEKTDESAGPKPSSDDDEEFLMRCEYNITQLPAGSEEAAKEDKAFLAKPEAEPKASLFDPDVELKTGIFDPDTDYLTMCANRPVIIFSIVIYISFLLYAPGGRIIAFAIPCLLLIICLYVKYTKSRAKPQREIDAITQRESNEIRPSITNSQLNSSQQSDQTSFEAIKKKLIK